MKSVAVVGLGAMGYAIAKNLLSAGFDVRGSDIRQSAVDAFKAEGGQATTSIRDAAAGADVLLLMVVNAEQAMSIVSDHDTLQALNADATVMLMATCPASDVVNIHQVVAKSGRRFVDAPVSGGQAGAREASLTIMAAGDAKNVEAIRPVLDAIGKKIFHVGEQPGQGAMMKTINQLLCGVHLAAAGEALALAAHAGLDLEMVLSILRGSSASSWMLGDRGPRMLQPEPRVTSAVDIFVKDLDIVLTAGRSEKFALPITAAAYQMFVSASGRGQGNDDDSRVIDSYFALARRESIKQGANDVECI